MLVFQSIYGLGVIIKFVLSIRRAAITRDYWAIQADLNMDFVWFDKGLYLAGIEEMQRDNRSF